MTNKLYILLNFCKNGNKNPSNIYNLNFNKGQGAFKIKSLLKNCQEKSQSNEFSFEKIPYSNILISLIIRYLLESRKGQYL